MENKKGISTSIIVIVVAVVLILVGFFFYNSELTEAPTEETESMEESEVISEKEGTMMEESDTSMNMESENNMEEDSSYTGEVLAGNQAILLDFKMEDYQKALNEKAIVVLYFYANWCPTCRAEFPKIQSAFEKLQNPDVIGFRVNFNDNETDSFEKGLAREFGVAYQHTKVILQNGERVLKSPETWEESRYLSEINSLSN